jgi:hypothetical protein
MQLSRVKQSLSKSAAQVLLSLLNGFRAEATFLTSSLRLVLPVAAQPERRVLPGPKATKVPPELPVLPVRRVPRVQLDLQALTAPLAPPVPPVLLVPPELPVLPVLMAQMVEGR